MKVISLEDNKQYVKNILEKDRLYLVLYIKYPSSTLEIKELISSKKLF